MHLFLLARRLLLLIQRLHTDHTCRICLSSLSEQVLMNRGVKLGCVFTPTLCNLHINDLAPSLLEVISCCPRLGSQAVPILYADDMVLLSHTKIGLKCLTENGVNYLSHNKLLIMANLK